MFDQNTYLTQKADVFQNWQYKVESLGIWFQGGVKRWVLVAFGICLVLAIPLYFLFGAMAGVWFNTSINPNKFNNNITFQPKNIPEKKLTFGETQRVPLKDKSSELYMVINNKENPLIGYNPFVYDIQVVDNQNNEISRETRSTYILPGDIKYITFRSPNLSATKLIVSQNDKTQRVYYNPNSINQKPNIQITNQDFKVRTFTDILYVSMSIKNLEKFAIKGVDVLYTIRDARESVIGIGEYRVTNLESSEQRDLTKIEYTQPASAEPTGVDIIWSVNYLESVS